MSLPDLPVQVSPARVSLARLPTPVQPLRRVLPALLPGAGRLPALWAKRDDLSGAELSGNKVRKLEFLLAEAIGQGARAVITCGGAQSNHCRATALAAARLGLRCQLLLRTPDPEAPPPLGGNLLLGRLCGATVRFITPAQYQQRQALMAEWGEGAYVIPEGGSNALGCLGYVHAVAELAAQLPEGPLTLWHATGSGGTAAGLLLGVVLCGLPWRVATVNVCDDRAYFARVVGAILDEAGQRFAVPEAAARARAALDVREGYVGRGYALSRPEELALLRDVCRHEGLVLDPVYTGKAFFGLISELKQDPGALGDTIVFLHTGGIFGLFDPAKVAEMAPLL